METLKQSNGVFSKSRNASESIGLKDVISRCGLMMDRDNSRYSSEKALSIVGGVL